MKKRKEMESMEFPEMNHVFTSMDKTMNYRLPAYRGKVDSGKKHSSRVVTCWRVPFWQRVGMIFHGKIWMETLGSGQSPVALHCRRKIFRKVK